MSIISIIARVRAPISGFPVPLPTSENIGLRLPAPDGPLHARRVLMTLAACRPSVTRGCHSIGNGRKTCALPGKPPNQVPCGPMEKQGFNDACSGAGRRHWLPTYS